MARSFNGTSDFITVTNNALLSPTTYLSCAGWMFVNSFANWAHCIVKPARTTWTLPYMDYGLRIEGNGSGNPNVVTLTVSGTTIPSGIAQGTVVSTGVWVHIAGTYDGVNVRTYLNGKLDWTGALTGAINANGQNLHLGFSQTGDSAGNLNGNIADAAVWGNAVLSGVEIYALAHGARPGNIRPGSVAAWWPFDGYILPAIDRSLNRNNGVLTGTAFVPGPPLISAAPIFPGIAMPEAFTFIPPPVFILMPQIVT